MTNERFTVLLHVVNDSAHSRGCRKSSGGESEKRRKFRYEGARQSQRLRQSWWWRRTMSPRRAEMRRADPRETLQREAPAQSRAPSSRRSTTHHGRACRSPMGSHRREPAQAQTRILCAAHRRPQKPPALRRGTRRSTSSRTATMQQQKRRTSTLQAGFSAHHSLKPL